MRSAIVVVLAILPGQRRSTWALALALAAAAGLAGCATPSTPTPATTVTPTPSEGPVELAGKSGLVAIDVANKTVQALSEVGTLAWISPGGSFVLWNEGAYAIVYDTRTGAREVVATARISRLYDNGTALETHEGEARWRAVLSPTANTSAPLPPAPRPGTTWTQLSDDLAVLGVEYPTTTGSLCGNDLYVRGVNGSHTTGCHLRVAADGRAGWTELGTVRVRSAAGDIATTSPPTNDTRLENPVFARDGLLYLRLHGRAAVTLTEVVDEDGAVVAKLTGSGRMALLDATADGNIIVASIFRSA